MSIFFWLLLAVHVVLCLFLVMLVLLQNDQMGGGLAGLAGGSSQAFSTAGAATFVLKLTIWVAMALLAVVLSFSFYATKLSDVFQCSELIRAVSSGLGSVLPQEMGDLQDLPTVPME